MGYRSELSVLMKITLEIKDSKAAAFLNFIKSLDFIQIKTNEDVIEPTNEEILSSITQGIREVELHQIGDVKLQNAKDFLDEI